MILSWKAVMLKTIEGIVRNGKIELVEPPPADEEGSRVVVTFLPARNSINLRDRGIDSAQAGDLKNRLQTFAEDWDRPEMDVYDED